MADCKSARLSKKEVRFIKTATIYATGVYDFENTTNSEFRKSYGIQKSEMDSMLFTLKAKMDQLLTQFEKETTKQP